MRSPQISGITNELVKMARAPLIDHLKKTLGEKRSLQEQVAMLLSELYFAEFEIIDGHNQHPQGLTFGQWCLLREQKQ